LHSAEWNGKFSLMEQSVIVKLFRLIETLAAATEAQPLGELADTVALPKPTTHRLLKIMVELGYVERTEGGWYGLTSKLREVASGNQNKHLLATAEPILAKLHKQIGETVNLGVLQQGRVVYLRVLESVHPLRRMAEPDSIDPFHCTALGRAIAAHMGHTARENLLEQIHDFERRTPFTVVDTDELRAILETVETEGCAIERDQTDVGVTCIGAPVFDSSTVVAAISISVPTARLPAARERELVRNVREAAASLSAKLSRGKNGQKSTPARRSKAE
jgi:DNA-binding IclR family transcriptional regulator